MNRTMGFFARLSAIFGCIALFLSCHLSQVEQDGNVFSFPTLADSLAGADYATIVIKDTSGRVIDTLFHGPITPTTRFSRLEADGFKGGLVVISIEGSKGGTVIFREDRRYDGDKEDVVAVHSIVLPHSTVKINWANPKLIEGEGLPLPVVTINPASLAGSELDWTSRNNTVFLVSANQIQGVGAGSAYLVVILRSDTAKKDSILVEVARKPIFQSSLDSIRLAPDSLTLAVRGPPARFDVKTFPSTASPEILWSVVDTSRVSISADGQLFAKAPGRTHVVATSKTQTPYSDSSVVVVVDAVKVDSIRFAKRESELFVLGTAESLQVRVYPPLANPGIEFTISDASMARITEGKVQGLKDGETWVRAYSKEDPSKTDSMRLTIRPSENVQSVSVSPDAVTLYMNGESRALTASITPSTLSGRFLWRSSDPSVASVDESGTVKPGKAGIAYVSALARADSTKGDSTLVTVKRDVPKLSVGRDTVIAVGRTITFFPEVTQEYGLVVLFKWDLDGDGTYDDSSATVRKDLSHLYDAAKVYLVRFYVRDTEGNDTTVIRKVTAVNGPVILFLSPDDGAYVNKSPVNVTWSVDGVRQTASETLVEGANTITRSAKDAAGNGYSATLTVHLDTKAPIVKITAPVAGLLTRQSSIAVTWTVDAAAQSVRTTESLEGKQGKIDIIRDHIDAAGNRGADTVSVFRDTVAPGAVSFVSPTSPAVVNASHTLPVQWAWTRTGEAADSFLVSLNGAAAVKQAGTSYVLSNPANQNYTLQVQEVDVAGNISAPTSRGILVDKLAPPAPTVTGTTPTGSPTWNWSAGSGSDGARIFRYRLAPATDYSAEGPGASYSPSGLSSGTHTLYVQERDEAGNWSTDGSLVLSVDRTGPSLAISSPTEMGRVANFNPQVTGTVEDANAIRRVEYRMNAGGYVTAARTGGNWNFTGSYNVGLNQIWIRGEDDFGNRDSIQIRIYKYPNVVFVRKNATGTGKSWEDALGELHQALDTTKSHAAGTEIWVTKGKYKSHPSYEEKMYVIWSNVKILGGFNDQLPSIDTADRDRTYGATILANQLVVGPYDRPIQYSTVDGFSIKGDPGEYFGISSGETSQYLSFKNILAQDVKEETTLLRVESNYSTIENCVFINNYTYQNATVQFGGEGTMINCRFVNNGSTNDRAPIAFASVLSVEGGYFEGNYGYDDNGDTAIAHFSIQYGNLFLRIDKARIQGGINGIYRGSPPQGTLIYGNENVAF